MMLQYDYFCGLCQIYFGQFSWLTQLMLSLLRTLEKNKSSFKASESTNPQFCSKFMYAIDTHCQLWLEDCMLQTQQICVDDNILHFQPLIEQVQFETFKLKLPLVSKPKRKGNKRHQDIAKGKKKKG
jgi:hypothetical protein